MQAAGGTSCHTSVARIMMDTASICAVLRSLALRIVFLTLFFFVIREYCQYPLIDISYILSVVAMVLALYSAFAPDFYTYIDEEAPYMKERSVSLFTSIFHESDGETIAAFTFLVMAWLFSACAGGIISEHRYHVGYGDHEELLPGISGCLSMWYMLVGCLGFCSLVRVPYCDRCVKVLAWSIVQLILVSPCSCHTDVSTGRFDFGYLY